MILAFSKVLRPHIRSERRRRNRVKGGRFFARRQREFQSNGRKALGYFVTPLTGSDPGVLVIQEWWGLDSGIKEMADRLGTAGFVALAPDLYHGELAAHDEMDKAAQLMQSLPPDRAARDMSGTVDYLSSHPAVTSNGIGVVGFCMGGQHRRHDEAIREQLRSTRLSILEVLFGGSVEHVEGRSCHVHGSAGEPFQNVLAAP